MTDRSQDWLVQAERDLDLIAIVYRAAEKFERRSIMWDLNTDTGICCSCAQVINSIMMRKAILLDLA